MKKSTLLKFAAVGVAGYLMVCGYASGPAANGYDCTGAETGLGNPAGCSTGGGCHSSSATAGITVAIQLDSAGGKSTKYYVAGGSYTIKITATNTTSNNLPKFGFQLGAILGSTARTTPTPEGTFPTPYPTNTHYSAPAASEYVVGVVEHSTQLSPTTGTGGSGTTYSETIKWTAPAGSTGTCSLWVAMNCVNDNGNADAGDLWNTNHLVITQITPTGIAAVANDNGVKIYPNPFTSYATFAFDNGVNNATITLYDMTGKEVKTLDFSGKEVQVQRDGLASGIYFYNVVAGDQQIKSGKLIIQ
jgi:hypothetical protein